MSGKRQRERHEEKNHGPYPLRHALCAFGLPAHGAATGESATDSLSAGASPSAIAPRTAAFRQRLRELGYVEGKNIVIEFRYAEENLDRLPALAADLVRLKVDVIVTAGGDTPPVLPRKLLPQFLLSWPSR